MKKMTTRFVSKVSTMNLMSNFDLSRSQYSHTEGSEEEDESQWTAKNGVSLRKKMTNMNVNEFSPAKMS